MAGKVMRAKVAAVIAAGLLALTACSSDGGSADTPQACLDALDSADRLMALAGEGFGYASDALTAAGNLDAAGINAAGAGLQSVSDRVSAEAPKYQKFSADCRAEKA